MTASEVNKEKLFKVIELLEFALKLDDDEILRSTTESIIETLKELVVSEYF